MQKTMVAVVDDHQLFREGLTELINGFGPFEVVIQANNGKDFIAKLEHAPAPSIVLLDINMKEMDGYETALWINKNLPLAKILALSMYENEAAIIRMLRNGATGYVLKDIRKQELEQALLSMHTRGFFYTEMVTGKVVHAIHSLDDNKQASPLKDMISLNSRETEFLKLVCSESTYKNIADQMHLSVHTIDGYRDTLFEKLHVKSRVGLVLYAIKNKIVHYE